jgi:internalin A
LGIVINFKNLKNFDTQILNPLWLTNGVYRIINSQKVVDNGGILSESDFDAVINDPRYKKGNTTDKEFVYPTDKLNYIVRVMEEFELCFMLPNKTYVVPELLPIAEPDFNLEKQVLHFVVRFPEFMPTSIFPRLMVKLNQFIDDGLRWRTGMILYKPHIFNAKARIRSDKEDKEIRIDVCGSEPRRLLSFIRETIKEIMADFNVPIKEEAQIPNTKFFVPYSRLVALEKKKILTHFVEELDDSVDVAHLLDGVEEPEMRHEMTKIPVKAFISYSHKDNEYLQSLKNALMPLVRLNKLQLWDDHAIDAGEEWRVKIFKELAEADIVICLVSSDFIASDFCYKQEFETALQGHFENKKAVVPVKLRECHWKGLAISELQGTPNEWISSVSNKDAAWTQVAKGLEPAIEKAKARKQIEAGGVPF